MLSNVQLFFKTNLKSVILDTATNDFIVPGITANEVAVEDPTYWWSETFFLKHNRSTTFCGNKYFAPVNNGFTILKWSWVKQIMFWLIVNAIFPHFTC